MQNDNNYNTQNNYISNQSNQNSGTFDTVQNTNFNQNQLNTTIHSNNVLNASNTQNNIKNETKGSKKVVLIILLLIVIVAIVAVILFVIGSSNANTNTSTNTDNNNSVNDTINNNDNKKLTIDDVMNAPETPASDFEYNVTDEGVEITGYLGAGGVVVIPEKIEGVDVVLIGEDAFINDDSVTALKLSDTVKEVYDEAFVNCTALEIFISGASVKTLGQYAFNGCVSLKKVILNEGLEEIGAICFAGLSNAEVEVPATVKQMSSAFLGDSAENPIIIIGEPGSYAEQFVQDNGENYHLVFRAK